MSKILGVHSKVEVRNHIINGGLDFWQRVGANTTTVNTASPASNYTSDRILTYSDGPTVKNYSTLRSTSVPSAAQAGAALPFSRRFNCLTAIVSPAAADRVLPNIYVMEGQDAQALYGQTVTFGFWINTNVQGNHPFSALNSTSTRSYITSFNISAGESSTWVFKTATIPLESAGAIDNTRGLAFYIGGSLGSTYQTSLGSWQTGDFQSFAGAANLMSANTNFMQVAGLQLIIGSTLPSGSFVRAGRTIGHELQLCQRYYEKSCNLDLLIGDAATPNRFYTGILNASGGGAHGPTAYMVRKRAAPSIQYANGSVLSQAFWRRSAADGTNTITFNGADTYGFEAVNVTAGGAYVISQLGFSWAADAEL